MRKSKKGESKQGKKRIGMFKMLRKNELNFIRGGEVQNTEKSGNQ